MGLSWREVLLIGVCCLSLSLVHGQQQFDCCTANMMQSMGRAIIERDFQMVTTPTTVRTVRLRQCAVMEMSVQFWRKVSSGEKSDGYELVLDIPLKQDGMGNIYEFHFTNPITILPSWRLGFKGPPVSADLPNPIIAIPYFFGNKYRAIRSIQSNKFQINKSYDFTKITWPLTFTQNKTIVYTRGSSPANYNGYNIMFCEEKRCPGVSSDASVTSTIVTGPPGPPGPAGPSGPPGASGTTDGKCTCKDPKSVTELQNMGQKQVQMQGTLDNIRTLVAELSRGNQPTGKCPVGFISGTFGVGSCYLFVLTKVPVGVAQMQCQEKGARLLRVETDLEHKFLLNALRNFVNSDTDQMFWTAGIWSMRKVKWLWHDEIYKDSSLLNFQNWAPGEAAVNIKEVNKCLALKVSRGSQLLWYSRECPELMSYVCEKKKDCL